MTNEFKKISQGDVTRYILESESAGATGSGSIASVPGGVGKVQKRGNLLAQEEKKEAPKPRNFVAKNAKMGGAGQHKDKKKAEKQGDAKHKKPFAEGEVVPIGKKHRGDLEDTHSCPKCGGDLQGGTYMGQRVKVCQPCKQVYLPPNSGIDQKGNKIGEQGVAEGERTMSRAAKGNEKYGKDGMRALAKAGREGASEKKLDAIRDKHDNYNEEAKHGLYYNVNKRKAAGTSRPASSPKAPTAQAWKDAAKTAKKESIAESEGRCMQCGMKDCKCPGTSCKCKPIAGWVPGKGFKKAMDEAANAAQQAAIAIAKKKKQGVEEEWSKKYKSSINCSHPKGFSQKAHCAGKKKHNESMMTMEAVCPDCGMCQTHGNLSEIKKGAKDSNGVTKCWSGYHAAGTKKSPTTGKQVRNCVPNEGIGEAFQNDESNLYYRYDPADGRVKQRMVHNNDERQAFSQGFKDTPEQALQAHGIIRSKFDPKKFVQKQGNKWVPVFPFGKPEDTSEDHSTATGGYGRAVRPAIDVSSRLIGNGHNDRLGENPEWYNDEANDMTSSQLKSLVKHAARLRNAVKQMQAHGDTLEPWQQSKVTKAADYLDAVFNAVDDDIDMGESNHPDEKEDKELIRKMVKHAALKQEDGYMAELQAKLAEKISKNAPVDVYIKDFEKSNAPQFRGKTKEKRRQMAIAASYGAKTPSIKKK
jgi:hypothetical protein